MEHSCVCVTWVGTDTRLGLGCFHGGGGLCQTRQSRLTEPHVLSPQSKGAQGILASELGDVPGGYPPYCQPACAVTRSVHAHWEGRRRGFDLRPG